MPSEPHSPAGHPSPNSPAVEAERDAEDACAWAVHVVAPSSPLIVHVPHAGTWIPARERRDILLDDGELAVELALMTDWHTDRLALDALAKSGVGANVFVNRASRLLVDPERFADHTEVMATVGMGAVYTATSCGQPLRTPDRAAEQRLLDRWFHPYAAAFTQLVDDTLAEHGRAIIIDLHSFPSSALPYELVQAAVRPGVCLGTHHFHTPMALLAAARRAFDGVPGGVEVDTPFAGTYVPLCHLGTTVQVSSIMVEIRRDLYQQEPGGPASGGFVQLMERLASLLAWAAEPRRQHRQGR